MTKTSKAEIIAAARDLMRDRGYAGTSMKDVASEVGLLKGSLYSHFASKEELVPEVLRRTRDELVAGIAPTGDWRADYQTALDRLVSFLSTNGRCVGLHLAYGLDDSTPALKQAVGDFFREVCAFLESLLVQGLDTDLARPLALDTLLHIEGATLWRVLFDDDGPMQAARTTLLAYADDLAAPPPPDDVRALLDRMLGDWRRASATERQLATRLVAAEGDLLTVRAALAGQIEAESCFR